MKKNIDNYIVTLNTRNNLSEKYLFEIGNEFFKTFNHSEVKEANIKADIILTNEKEKFTLNIKLYGKVYNLLCDLCADKVSISINASSDITIIKTTANIESTDEIIYVSPHTQQFSIKHLLFELISVSIPKKRKHRISENGESNCDAEMIELIEKYTKIKTAPSENQWSILKDLKIT